MYRLRSADKGKPLLISSLIIDEYSEVCSFHQSSPPTC